MKTLRNIFITILLMIALQCSLSAQVVIKPETARYFLEADDERFVLRKKDSVNTVIITDLKKEIIARELIAVSYKTDIFSYIAEIKLVEEEKAGMAEDIDYLEREVLRQHRLKMVGIGAGSGAVIGSFSGPVGAIAGAAVGAGVGYVASLFKKKI